jgi:hypothetical protein
MVEVTPRHPRRCRFLRARGSKAVGRANVGEAKVDKANVDKVDVDGASFGEVDIDEAVAELTTLGGIISHEKEHLVKRIGQKIFSSMKEPSKHMEKNVLELVYRCLVIENMTGTLSLMIDHLTELKERPKQQVRDCYIN